MSLARSGSLRDPRSNMRTGGRRIYLHPSLALPPVGAGISKPNPGMDTHRTVAPDGAKALDRLAEDPSYGVVLLDLMMPGMDGRELLHRIRQDPRLRAVR